MNNIEKFLLFFCEPVKLYPDANFIVFELKSAIKANLGGAMTEYVEITCVIPDDFSDIDFSAWFNNEIIVTTTIKKGEPITFNNIKKALHELIEKVNKDKNVFRKHIDELILINHD